MLDLLQAGGSVLGQAMEQVTGGNLPSMLLIACAFTLSLVYLLRLAVGHLAPPLPAGAVRAPLGVLLGGRCDQGDRRASEGLAPRCCWAVAAGALEAGVGRGSRGSSPDSGGAGGRDCPDLAELGAGCPDVGRVPRPRWGPVCRDCGLSDGSVDRGTTGSPNGRGRGGGCGPERPVMVLAAVRGVSALVGALLVMFWAASALVVVILGGCP